MAGFCPSFLRRQLLFKTTAPPKRLDGFWNNFTPLNKMATRAKKQKKTLNDFSSLSINKCMASLNKMANRANNRKKLSVTHAKSEDGF